jgi:hypothetical protein
LKQTDWAYLAGIIDGEGSIGIYKGQPRIVVAMRSKQPCLWIYLTFGGCWKRRLVKELGEHRVRYTWGVYSKDKVRKILEGCLPYLKTKRSKAKEVLHEGLAL